MPARRETRGRNMPRIAAATVAVSFLAFSTDKPQHNQEKRTTPSEISPKTAADMLVVKLGIFATYADFYSPNLHYTLATTNTLPRVAIEAPTTTTEISPTTTTTTLPVSSTAPTGLLRRIAGCESAGSPTASIEYQAQNPHSSASGGYQFLDQTWDDYDGYPHAKDAPPAVQDQKAKAVFAVDYTQPWVSSEACWN